MRQIESFFWGIIAALGALFVQLVIFIVFSIYMKPGAEISFSQLFMLPQFIIFSAFIEESFKYLVISKRVEAYSLKKSSIVNSLFVGLGFMATEFWLISNSQPIPPVRTFVELAIVHLGTAGIIGYLMALKNPKRIISFLYIVALVTALHSSYNLLIQRRDPLQDYLIFLLLGALIIANIFNLLRVNRKLAR